MDHPVIVTGKRGEVWPVPVFTAVDDLGTAYCFTALGGGSSDFTCRFEHEVTPGIPDAAQRLEIELSAVQSQATRWPVPTADEAREIVDAGPWRFVIDLSKRVAATRA